MKLNNSFFTSTRIIRKLCRSIFWDLCLELVFERHEWCHFKDRLSNLVFSILIWLRFVQLKIIHILISKFIGTYGKTMVKMMSYVTWYHFERLLVCSIFEQKVISVPYDMGHIGDKICLAPRLWRTVFSLSWTIYRFNLNKILHLWSVLS